MLNTRCNYISFRDACWWRMNRFLRTVPLSRRLKDQYNLCRSSSPMFTIGDSIFIKAPIERCFLLSTNVELVGRTYGMKPIEGKTKGMVEADDKLLWAGWKFGFPQMHESVISQYEKPSFFQDTMTRERFKRYQHDHYFYEMDGRTV